MARHTTVVSIPPEFVIKNELYHGRKLRLHRLRRWLFRCVIVPYLAFACAVGTAVLIALLFAGCGGGIDPSTEVGGFYQTCDPAFTCDDLGLRCMVNANGTYLCVDPYDPTNCGARGQVACKSYDGSHQLPAVCADGESCSEWCDPGTTFDGSHRTSEFYICD